MNCTRGHGKNFMVNYVEIKKHGDGNKIIKRCSYIMGTVDGRGITCGHYPNDADLPKNMLKVDGSLSI